MLETFVFIQILWIFRMYHKKKTWTFRKRTTKTQEVSWAILLTFAYCLKWDTILLSFFKNASKLKIFKIENEIDVFVLKICVCWEFSCGSLCAGVLGTRTSRVNVCWDFAKYYQIFTSVIRQFNDFYKLILAFFKTKLLK